VLLLGTALVLLSLLILRAGYSRLGVALYILVSAAFSLTAPFVGHPRQEIYLVGTAMIPILIAAMLLSRRWVPVVTAVTVGVAALELLTFPLNPADAATGFGTLSTVLATGLLLVVLRWHYGRLEAIRSRQLQESEAAVRASEARLRALVERSGDLIVVLDAEGTRKQLYGDVQGVIGHRPEDRGPLSHFDSIHPDDLERVKKELVSLVSTHDTVAAHRVAPPAQGRHLPLARSSGQQSLGRARCERNRAQRARRHRAADGRQALLRNERRYRTLFETVTDAIFLADGRGRLVEVNDAACRQLGYSREELLGMHLTRILPEEQQASLPDVQRLVAEKGRVLLDTRHRRRDGSTYPVELVVSVAELDGEPAFLGVARDTTERVRSEAERRRLEEQLQHAGKLESIGRLAGGVAHDFNIS